MVTAEKLFPPPDTIPWLPALLWGGVDSRGLCGGDRQGCHRLIGVAQTGLTSIPMWAIY